MCYDAQSATRRDLKYSLHRATEPAEREILKKKLQELLEQELKSYYHVSGFAHPKLLVFTNTEPYEPKALNWGLIPSWVKDAKQAKEMSNITLNAKGETIFEKPSFKNSALNKRCLIYLDAFYEHYHFNGKTYPFRIKMKDDSPLIVAGLWEDWLNKSNGESIQTVSMVTTKGNSVMVKIHNNPKIAEPRMPLILTKENQNDWLKPLNQNQIEGLIKPLDESLLEFHTVGRLKGKNAIGNIQDIEMEVEYPELPNIF